MKKLCFIFLSVITFIAYASNANFADNGTRNEQISNYFHKINTLDAQGAMALFTQDGKVVSRHLGEVNPDEFYPMFVQKFRKMTMQPVQSFIQPDNPDSYAIEVASTGVKTTNEVVSSMFMVIFDFSSRGTKFKKITIFANDVMKHPKQAQIYSVRKKMAQSAFSTATCFTNKNETKVAHCYWYSGKFWSGYTWTDFNVPPNGPIEPHCGTSSYLKTQCNGQFSYI